MNQKNIFASKISELIFPCLLLLIIIFIFFWNYFSAIDPLNSLLLIASLLVLVIFVKRPDLGLYLIIFSIIIGQLVRIPLGKSGGILISDILVIGLFFIYFVKKIFSREKWYISLSGLCLLLFLSVAFLSLLNGLRLLETNQMIISFFYFLRLLSYGGIFFITQDVLQGEKKIYSFKKILIITFLIFAILGIVQLIFYPNLSLLTQLEGWDPHMGRLFSTFLDPNFAGAFLTIAFIVATSLLFYTKSIEGKVTLFVLASLSFISIILTYSRSAYLFLAISFIVLCLLKSRKIILLGIVAFIILALIFPRTVERLQGIQSIDESARARFKSWGNTLIITRDYPLLGVGYNSFRYAQERYNFVEKEEKSHSAAGSDSSGLLILVTTGIIGFIFFILFYLSAMKESLISYWRSASLQKKAFGLALISILVGLIFNSIFINSLFYPAIMIPLFIILGIISQDRDTSSNLPEKEQ